MEGELEAYPGISQTKIAIIEYICAHDIMWPLHIIVQQRREQLELVLVSQNGTQIKCEFVSLFQFYIK